MNWQAVFIGMLPEHLLLAGALLLIVVELLSRRPPDGLPLALATLAAAFLAALWLAATGHAGEPFPGQLTVDPAAFAGKAVMLGLAIPVALLARGELEGPRPYLLLLFSLYGACLTLSADSFLTLFIGLELLSLPVYVLVMAGMRGPGSAEAALKYLVLGGTASAMLLMGASLLLGATGTLAIASFAAGLGAGTPLATAGVLLVVAAFFLKGAVVPFHAWAPDAYQGATVPVTAYMAAIVKAGVLLAAVRLFGEAGVPPALVAPIALLPLVSMAWGNLAAIRQSSFRRMIAYSSIAHAGYLFFAFLGAPEGRFEAVAFYVIAYGLMNVLAFAALPAGADDAAADRLESLQGLYSRRPYAAITLGIAMLSLAGLPPFPGFVAKFLIFRNVMEAGYTGIAVAGLLASYLGLYFYLRVLQFAFMGSASGETIPARRLALGASLLCLIPVALLTFFPGWLLERL
ncbi:MAG: NADH-quinone oxidoreductase subunit N [Steroidobacteraceae bacterium]|nr:NADH-quinone oxidoreductase subunit N [Steroidobacteraceae bacterium]